MKKRVELPLTEPIYQTYHNQGASTAVATKNATIVNWHFNQVMNLTCSRKFLNGFTTPELTISGSSWQVNPHLDKWWLSTQFTKGYVNPIIRELLDNGFYVAFDRVDDYYIKGKTWYKERHFAHDGLICGYDQNNKTYCIYAYDSNWIYRKFWISQKDFEAGRNAVRQNGVFSIICGMKTKDEVVEFSCKTAINSIKEYLDSSLEKYPWNAEGNVYGIVVHEYIAEYVAKLYRGDITYERMDRRVFRLIWEHKKVMLERIRKIEQSLNLNNEISEKYQSLVSEADTMRMLYASHHMRRRDSVLPIIKNKLLKIMDQEKELLTLLVKTVEKELNSEALEVSKK